METERGLDRAAAIAHMRFDFIEKVCDETVVKPKESKEHLRSVKIDTHSYRKIYGNSVLYRYHGTGIFPDFQCDRCIFVRIFLSMGITALGNIVDHWMTAAGVNDVIHSLVMDGSF